MIKAATKVKKQQITKEVWIKLILNIFKGIVSPTDLILFEE